MKKLGLALSGGGSRAMAFHRGTIWALNELGLTESIDVVSTVSGGSVFGAAWMCSRVRSESTENFLNVLVAPLRRGFVRPALSSFRTLKVLMPGFSRTNRLAEVFGDELLDNRSLPELPEHPALCLNTTVLNHGMAGRFSRGGFSTRDVGARTETGSYVETPLPRRQLSFAVTASAAFPFALPPLILDASELPAFCGDLKGHRQLFLTDGGVLENLGVERLLASDRFRSENIIVSDAGTAETDWSPNLLERATSFGAFALSRQTLSRLLTIMNDKQNKNMRQLLMYRSGVLGEVRGQRRLWFVRIDQTWERFFEGVTEDRRQAIAGEGKKFPARRAPAAEVVDFLEENGVELSSAKKHYDPRDGERANAVKTQFTGLDQADIDALAQHAKWQVFACKAVYGPIIPP